MTSGRASRTDARPLVVGLGNLERADDAAGLLVAQRVHAAAGDRLRVVEHRGDMTALFELWQGVDTLVLVDAVVSGAAEGTLHLLDVSNGVPAELRDIRRSSSHGLGALEAIELARHLGHLPRHTLLVGIEGRDFTAGNPPSEAVIDAVAAGARQVLDRLLPTPSDGGNDNRFERVGKQ